MLFSGLFLKTLTKICVPSTCFWLQMRLPTIQNPLYICSPKNKFFFITRLSTLHMPLNMSSTNQPAWMSASFVTFSFEEKKIIFEFCNLMKLFCKCGTKKIIGFKYCNLCLNLLINVEEAIIQINKQEIISVRNLLKYNKYLLK